MALITSFIPSTPLQWAVAVVLALFSPLLYYTVIWILDPLNLRRFPGPPLAAVTPYWLFWQRRNVRGFRSVDEAHKKYGKFVRIAPDQISINIPDAIQQVYAHGNGFTKSEFYNAFVSIHTGLFNTRSRTDHSRKRKIVSHTFSQQAIGGFEPYISKNISLFLKAMDKMLENKESVEFDFLKWANYLAFDIIGDLAFGEAFHFIEEGNDHNNGIKVLNERGEWSATVGTMPWIKPYTPYIFWDNFFPQGLKSVKQLAQIAITAVEKRKKNGSNRKDLLHFLINAKDPDTDQPIPDAELKAEALTQLIAGSDTTSNTLTHLLDLLCRNPDEYAKLVQELDSKLPVYESKDEIASYDAVKDLPYLNAIISETLRYRPTSSFGLPRLVPEGGANICGEFFKGGTVLSVPSYTIHHNNAAFPQADTYMPERWLSGKRASAEKYFIPFSYGPRACVGRNVAMMELLKIVANLLKRYQFELVDPSHETVLREGFLVKPTELWVRMSRREQKA